MKAAVAQQGKRLRYSMHRHALARLATPAGTPWVMCRSAKVANAQNANLHAKIAPAADSAYEAAPCVLRAQNVHVLLYISPHPRKHTDTHSCEHLARAKTPM